MVVKVALTIPSVRKFEGWDSYKRAIQIAEDYNDFEIDVYVCGEEKDINPQIDKVLYSSPEWRKKEFGKENLWIMPPFTRHVNSLYAYTIREKLKYDMVITVDDDTECKDNFFWQHWSALNQPIYDSYESVFMNKDNVYPRGFPYHQRGEFAIDIGFNQGLWSNISDLNAHDYNVPRFPIVKEGYHIAQIGKGITISSMNTAIKSHYLPVYYQLVSQTRFDDIWSGLILKRLFDSEGIYMGYGNPIVMHNKFPRNIWEDNKKEAEGHEINEQLWDVLQKMKLSGDIWNKYKQIADMMPFDIIRKYMEGWIKLIEEFK